MNNEKIVEIIRDFVATDSRNAIPDIDDFKIYEEPLIGFATASDPMYEELRAESVIGPHHKMPADWLDGAKSVISYFLPFTKEIVESNSVEGPPSGEWYLARYWGEEFNIAMRDHLVKAIVDGGTGANGAVAPVISEGYLQELWSSNWSERHTAFIAGMGTFCLSYALISEKGCAGRYGSVITNIELVPTPRTAKGLMENCLDDRDGVCDVCIERCPAGAISHEKKDHNRCMMYIIENVVGVYPEKYGVYTSGCGKCQTSTPCDRVNPKREK